MNEVIQYFDSIPSLHRTIILVAGISFFWILEGIFPIVQFKYRKWKHAGPNFFFTLTTLIINLFFAFLIVRASDWSIQHQFGLLNQIDLPIWLYIILGVAIMDFVGAFLIHWIEHKVYFLWKFHVIHHSDEYVDTTTALRHHPGESVLRASFTLLAVLIVGAPIWLLMIYQTLSALFSQFNHSNLKLPKAIDKGMSYVLVTPGMHRIHHHFEQPLSDRNYGNIFSIWDHLSGNYAWVPYEDVKFGLDVYTKSPDSIKDLLNVPVDGQSYTHRQ